MVSAKEGVKILLITLVATILAIIIQVIVAIPHGADIVIDTLKDPSKIKETIESAFTIPMSSFSLFVIIVMLFAFSTSFLNSINTLFGVGGIELSAPKVKAKKEKKAKKKVKEKKEKKAEEATKPAAEEEPVIDTGNYCKMCGKPISLGRAICKECEAILRGEAPPSASSEEAGA